MDIKKSVQRQYCDNCKHLVKFQSNCRDCNALVIGPLQGGCMLDVFKYYIIPSKHNK